ncbi:O-antigen ligase [Salinibacter ruber]|jgi:O-antigen ligase|uniref:O-antigen ligase family protein n=1 Tax=Salinibacter ruber TaxID=146919 RepID=UPI0021683FF9|nr:O-antigen ligase family protein [Salinibacter ruber]MCS3650584.1 O-antigen ligase [Salinibacter ruber]MCS3653836.1 O-antigen ligase [Salinibacter ruber]
MRLIKFALKAFLLASFFVPLFLDIGPVGVATWTGPFIGLLYIKLAELSIYPSKANRTKFYKWGSVLESIQIGKWEASGLTFILWMYFSTLVNDYYYKYPSRDGLLFVYSLSILFAIYVRKSWGKMFKTETIVWLSIAMIVVQSFISMLQFATSSTIGFPAKYFGSSGGTDLLKNDGAVRVIGTLDSSPTILGRAISVFLPFVAIYPAYDFFSLKSKLIKAVVMSAGFVTILMTQSRSAAIVVGSVVVLWLLQRSRAGLKMLVRPRTSWSKIYFVYSLVGILGVGVLTLQKAGGISYIEKAVSSTLYRFDNLALLGNRYQLMKGALLFFWENPVIGNGYLSTMYLAEQTDIFIVPSWRSFLRVHNAYLQFLAEGGIVAFMSYLYFTLYPLYRMWNSEILDSKTGIAFFTSISMIVVLTLTSTAYDRYSLSPLYMILLGGAMGETDFISSVKPSNSIDE